MGRPRKTDTLKRERNTLRPSRKVRPDAAARIKRAPSAPARLSARAAAEWRRLAPVAVKLGTLTPADSRAFELLCETLASEAEARELIAKEGMTTTTDSGGVKPHPAVRVVETARAQAARLLADFGMTPRGRQSVDVTPLPNAAHVSPATKYLNP
jgi:P27 family predicted phage terminase small subunit